MGPSSFSSISLLISTKNHPCNSCIYTFAGKIMIEGYETKLNWQEWPKKLWCLEERNPREDQMVRSCKEFDMVNAWRTTLLILEDTPWMVAGSSSPPKETSSAAPPVVATGISTDWKLEDETERDLHLILYMIILSNKILRFY